jgi:hypothetical protein
LKIFQVNPVVSADCYSIYILISAECFGIGYTTTGASERGVLTATYGRIIIDLNHNYLQFD